MAKAGEGQGVVGLQFTGYSHKFNGNPKTPTGEVYAMAMTRQKVLDQYFMDARHKLTQQFVELHDLLNAS